METLQDFQARFDERRKLSKAETDLREARYAEIAPNVVVGEVWELEIGRFKVVSAGNKYVKLKRL